MIHVRNLSYSYGRKQILRNIGFDIETGGFYALLGANGCGKTTLLRCIAGLLKPQTGEVALGEGGKGNTAAAEAKCKPLSEYSARELAQQISLVRQQTQTDFEFSAFETVLMGRNPYQRRLQNESQADWDLVERCMRQTNTWHLRFALPGEMSGGELQRVMIARALAQSTPVMLLDEPTSNLDIVHQFDIMELLRDINQRENKTILLVVHDLNLALHYCPKTILLHNGEILFKGDTADALTPENIQAAFGVNATLCDGLIRFQHR